jgi:hypothetical protein
MMDQLLNKKVSTWYDSLYTYLIEIKLTLSGPTPGGGDSQRIILPNIQRPSSQLVDGNNARNSVGSPMKKEKGNEGLDKNYIDPNIHQDQRRTVN